MRRQQRCHKRRKDINDLVADIIAQARYEWQAPNRDEYRSVCGGDDLLGHERCMFWSECYGYHGQPTGKRYRECLHRRSANRLELIRFFNSPWCEFLMGGVDPSVARDALGVPTL